MIGQKAIRTSSPAGKSVPRQVHVLAVADVERRPCSYLRAGGRVPHGIVTVTH